MENLFENCFTNKGSRIKVKTIEKYANKCDKIMYGCDEMKLISQNDYLFTCPCFQKIMYNGTNSKDVLLDCSSFTDCIFDSISISLDVFPTCMLFKVYGVYESKPYDLVDFRFYTEDSKKSKVNGYVSDILIHGKAWRLQVVSGGKFNIYDFLTDLVSYDTKSNERFLVALEEYYITRFDFRIDFFHENSIPYLKYNDVYLSDARSTVENLVIDRSSKKIYTGWTAGNRKIKYVYTRMYQKQVEALDKGHGELYYDYLSYPGKVWRLEFEFGSKFTTYPKHYSLSDEYLNHELTKKVFEYIGLSEKHGYFSKPKNKIEVPFNSLSLYQKQRVITQYKNYTVKLYKSGFNPYTIVNEALQEEFPQNDRQVLEGLFETSIWGDSYNDIISDINKTKTTIKEYYDNIYKAQLGVDQ